MGWLEGSDCGLIVLRQVMVDGFLSSLLINVRENPMDQQPHGAQGKPKRHFPCSRHVLEIRLVDVCEVAHVAGSGPRRMKSWVVSMPEETVPGEQHGDTALIGSINDFLISN